LHITNASVGAGKEDTMNFAYAFSLALFLVAVLGVFILIPFVSSYAFWFSVAAYIILASTVGRH
jgi:hypothetical protein